MNDTAIAGGATGASLLPDTTDAFTIAHLAVLAIFALVVIVAIVWGVRMKARRKAAERTIAQHNAEVESVAVDTTVPPVVPAPPAPSPAPASAPEPVAAPASARPEPDTSSAPQHRVRAAGVVGRHTPRRRRRSRRVVRAAPGRVQETGRAEEREREPEREVRVGARGQEACAGAAGSRPGVLVLA